MTLSTELTPSTTPSTKSEDMMPAPPKSDSAHWDNIFSRTEETKLGWYEKDTAQTFRLLARVPGLDQATVFLPGAGTSILIEDLLPRVNRLILNDISGEALDLVKRRLGKGAEDIIWLCQDIARPFVKNLPRVDVWIDRAVLHFLTDESDIRGYFENLTSVLKTGGHAIFAEFSLEGAPKCAGLTLHRYSVDELSKRLGPFFRIVSHFEYTYMNPFGDQRPYIYVLFRRER